MLVDNYHLLNYNFPMFLSESTVFDELPNNFIVSFDNNSNLYPVFILSTTLLVILLA